MTTEEKARRNGSRHAFPSGGNVPAFGLSKRELMATVIMAGCAADAVGTGDDQSFHRKLAANSVLAADALLLVLGDYK